MDTTWGQVALQVQRSTIPREFFLYALVYDAINELDVGAIEQIIKRVDGAVPDERDRDQYANLIGDALEDVLDQETIYELCVQRPTDPTIITLAKALYIISTRPCGKDPQKRRDRSKAMEIIFQRTGGRKNIPVKEIIEHRFVDADWMASLPSGENNG